MIFSHYQYGVSAVIESNKNEINRSQSEGPSSSQAPQHQDLENTTWNTHELNICYTQLEARSNHIFDPGALSKSQ